MLGSIAGPCIMFRRGLNISQLSSSYVPHSLIGGYTGEREDTGGVSGVGGTPKNRQQRPNSRSVREHSSQVLVDISREGRVKPLSGAIVDTLAEQFHLSRDSLSRSGAKWNRKLVVDSR